MLDDNHMENISLSQGADFLRNLATIKQTGQPLLKTQEGFENIVYSNQVVPILNSVNKDIIPMEADFNNTTSQITNMTAYEDKIVKHYVDNPFRGKYKNQNVRFPNGAIYYVDNMGIAKWYPSMDIYTNTAGKNGCPPQYVQLNSPDPPEGMVISPIGMTRGQSCGNEGLNVQVNEVAHLSPNDNPHYEGCSNVNGGVGTILGDVKGYPTTNAHSPFNLCKMMANDNGFQYFGLTQLAGGNQQCIGYKQMPSQNLGMTAIWHTGTTSTELNRSNAKLGANGLLTVALIANPASISYTSTNVKNISQSDFHNSASSSGLAIDQNFYLVVQDDGNLVIYGGNPRNWGSVPWATYTNGQQQSPNPAWAPPNGKTRTNYLSSADTPMAPGEWIGSPSGNMMLLMQQDGNLVLYTSNSSYKTNMTPCAMDSNSKQDIGGMFTQALFSWPTSGNPALLGKVGYISDDGMLSEYPPEMVKLGSTFTIMPQTDVPNDGNLPNGYIANSTPQSCEAACLNYTGNTECTGATFIPAWKGCNLKGNINGFNINDMTKREHNVATETMLLVRNRVALSTANHCGGDHVAPQNVDSTNWNGIPNAGVQMEEDSLCGLSSLLSETSAQIRPLQENAQGIYHKTGSTNSKINTESTSALNTLMANLPKGTIAEKSLLGADSAHQARYQEAFSLPTNQKGSTATENTITTMSIASKRSQMVYGLWMILLFFLIGLSIALLKTNK